jgi:hypothetical protein
MIFVAIGGTKVVLVLVAGDVVRVDRVEAEDAKDAENSNFEVCCVVVVGLISDFDLLFSVSCRLFRIVRVNVSLTSHSV